MAAVGWVHHDRDLRVEHGTLAAMSAVAGSGPVPADAVRLARRAGFVVRGDTAYAAWRRTEQRDPERLAVVNGRITNRERLWAQLGTRPVGDADLILHAYQEWGAGLVSHLDGVYAIAVWDDRVQRLLLISDPMGVRTWFYRAEPGNGLVFATRLAAVLAHPTAPRRVTADGLAELIAFGPGRTPGHAVVDGVHELPAGHVLEAVPGRIQRRPYWQWRADRYLQDIDTTVAMVRRLLADATSPLRRHPGAAVLLSGGLSSAAVAAFASSPDRRPDAYTLTLADPALPASRVDSFAATRTAQHMALPHHLLSAALDDLTASTLTATTAVDFPGDRATDATLLTLLDQIAQRGTREVVTGLGAASLFGSHSWLHHRTLTFPTVFPWLPEPLMLDRLLSRDARQHLQLDLYRRQRLTSALREVPTLEGERMASRTHRQLTHLTVTGYLPIQLRRLDQLATSAGLIAHTPIADFVLAQYALNIPAAIRHPGGRRPGLLRQVVTGLFPEPIAVYDSKPFPAAHRLANWRSQQHDLLCDMLTDSSQPLHPLLDMGRLSALLDYAPRRALPGGWWPLLTYLLDVNVWLHRHQLDLA